MATIKVKFRPSCVAEHEGAIFYLITHKRQSRQIYTNYKVLANEWNARQSMVSARHSKRQLYIQELRKAIQRDLDRLMRIIRHLHNNDRDYTIDDLLSLYDKYISNYSLQNYAETIIGNLKQNGRIRTSETYEATLRSFNKFINSRTSHGFSCDIILDCITDELIQGYESWLKMRGLTPNTTSFYMRIMRAIYNRAVEDDIIEDTRPFRHVYTGVEKTLKRAVQLSEIRKIKLLNLDKAPKLDYARDMFLLSFFLRGMSLVDMAYLRKSDLKNGHIKYRRRKTGQQLTIEWTREMQQILCKYPENKNIYLLPIITNTNINERAAYLNASFKINKYLKQIGIMIGLKTPLTLYVARHSWASAAKTKGIPLSVIAEGLGHDNEATTQIYLANFDTSVVDKANSLIIQCLR